MRVYYVADVDRDPAIEGIIDAPLQTFSRRGRSVEGLQRSGVGRRMENGDGELG